MAAIKKSIALFLSFCLVLVISINDKAYAVDPITATQIGGISIALMESWGISVAGTTGMTGEILSNYMSNQVNDYVGERSIADVFIADTIRVETGKLVLGHQIYNTVKQFIQSWLSNNDVQNVPTSTMMISSGTYYGYPVYIYDRIQNQQYAPDIILPPYYSFFSEPTAEGLSVITWISGDRQYSQAYINGSSFGNAKYNAYSATKGRYTAGWTVAKGTNDTYASICKIYVDNSTNPNGVMVSALVGGLSANQGDINVTVGDQGYTIGDDLVTGQQWGGWIEGSADTNLEQLIGTIYDDAAIDDLIIDTDDPPAPEPTPVPTPYPVEPDTPLSDVPWEGLNDLIDMTGQSINQQIQSQTQSITSSQAATTEAVESLTDTISGALDVPDDQEITDFKFDLRELFPFCIPFDIYRLLQSFDAEPIAPHVQLPFYIESLNFRYNLDLDFAVFNPVAQVLRTLELILYALGLAWGTGKVIKW